MNTKILEFYEKLEPQNKEIDFSSLEEFLKRVEPNNSTRGLAKKCAENFGEFKCYKSGIVSLLNANLHIFINDNTVTKRKIDNRERLLRTLILDYYFDSYIDEFLVPFLERNKIPDINRATARIKRAKSYYPEGTPKEEQILVNLAEKKLEATKEMYLYNWIEDFEMIKKVNRIIKKEDTNLNINVCI